MLRKQYVVVVEKFDALFEPACYTKQFRFDSFKEACEFYAEEKWNEFDYEDHWFKVKLPFPVWEFVLEKHKVHGNPAGNEYLAYYRQHTKEMDDFLNSLDDNADVSFEEAMQSVFGVVKEVEVPLPVVEEEVFDKGDVVF